MNRYDWLEDALLANPGAQKDYKPEWDWFRYLVDGHMFAATCRPGPEHKGYDCRDLLTLKCDPLYAELLCREYADIVPGFYCNKRLWISVFLDGSVPDELLRELCAESYRLVARKKRR